MIFPQVRFNIHVVAFALLVLLAGCQKPNKRVASKGTVDGGGGNVLCEKNGKSCSILDLVENKDKVAFDFDLGDLAEIEFKGNVNLINENSAATIFYNGDADLKTIFGENSDFFIWYLNQVIMSNSQLENSDKSLRFIGAEAFGIDGGKVKNLQYYFTEREIPLLKDQGFIGIENPEDLKQVALQDKLGQVLIQKAYFSKLNFKNKFALKLHESILFILINLNPQILAKNGTSKIRQFVKSFVDYRFEKLTSKGGSPINLEKLTSDFSALEIPILKAKYELIGQISDAKNSTDKVCKLKRELFQGPDGKLSSTANYFFERDGQPVSNKYAMDIEFLMKIQIYLVKRGICIFEPKQCDVQWAANETMVEYQGYAVHLDGEALPEVHKDMTYVQEAILPKYRIARICK